MTIADFDWNKVDLKKAAKQLRIDLLDFADEIEKQLDEADQVVAHHAVFEEVDSLMDLIDRKLYSLQYESISELSHRAEFRRPGRRNHPRSLHGKPPLAKPRQERNLEGHESADRARDANERLPQGESCPAD